MQQHSDGNSKEYFDTLRQKNYNTSFDGVRNFIKENDDKLHGRRRRKKISKWQWVLAVLLPVLIVLACTKTEHIEPVGQTISFSVPVGDGFAIQALEPIIGGLQTIISPNKKEQGYLSYTTFISAQSNMSPDVVISKLKAVKGIKGLLAMPINTKVKESLLSQLGSKIFSTHVDANAMSDEEMQNTVNRQLKEKGFEDISVAVTRNEKGVRTLQLQAGKVGPNYMIDVSADDKGTKMVLQEEKGGTFTKESKNIDPQPDFNHMTDAQVREYVRFMYGKNLRDEAIKITRTSEEIAISIKQSEKREEIIRYPLR